MHSTASFIAIFTVWIAGIVLILYLFLPSIIATRSAIHSNELSTKNDSLKQQMDIGDKSFISYSPLGIFDLFDN
jgi:hypothetical protein